MLLCGTVVTLFYSHSSDHRKHLQKGNTVKKTFFCYMQIHTDIMKFIIFIIFPREAAVPEGDIDFDLI